MAKFRRDSNSGHRVHNFRILITRPPPPKVTELTQLCNLILLKEFNKSVSKEVCAFIQEKNVSQIEDAAVIAETYALLHRGSSEKHVRYIKGKGDNIFKKHVAATRGTASPQAKVKRDDSDAAKTSVRPKTYFYCGKAGHQIKESRKKNRDIAMTRPVFLARLKL